MKKLLAMILALAMALTLVACGTAPETEIACEASMKHITVTVVHADGSSKVFEYETEEEFLGPVLMAEGLVQGEDGPYGLNITQVDGESAVYETDGAYWALYEGDEYALQGIDATPVVAAGTYKLEYTCG